MSEQAERHQGQSAGRDEEAVSRFVERFAAELTEAGMQRMASRVFAALLASDSGSLTSAELAEQLQISPAAVSGAVRYLVQVNMVRREREPGTRRDRYRLYNELWYETLGNREKVLTRWEEVLREGAKTLGPDTPAGARVAETVEFFEFMQGELDVLLERWREHRAQRLAEEG
ncbi:MULTISPECIES: GbsR/MarR family transcriptional regulator [Streptomyces]|nr:MULTISPECIES: MarR family transcriptional regulator [Streptomyces]KOG76518.1 MarR family transcriptional regulator [Kitasatospora aureofaciens]KEF03503.1 MarR family transcriptional regulator [Streptomyces rimosus]KEF21198.1 MarR family transcriptional regulator [Streptomyces rimosus]KUJ42818.1 MarR family transcriptional regulator [Streptomyces rimosus subsp. rimosus]UNZ04613.1 MarR family protein [Streptomyces rimosus subsp. rimosus]